jgi:hypothetical protein
MTLLNSSRRILMSMVPATVTALIRGSLEEQRLPEAISMTRSFRLQLREATPDPSS